MIDATDRVFNVDGSFSHNEVLPTVHPFFSSLPPAHAHASDAQSPPPDDGVEATVETVVPFHWVVTSRHAVAVLSANHWALRLRHGLDSVFLVKRARRQRASASKIVSYSGRGSGSEGDSSGEDEFGLRAELTLGGVGARSDLWVVTAPLKEHLEGLLRTRIEQELGKVASSAHGGLLQTGRLEVTPSAPVSGAERVHLDVELVLLVQARGLADPEPFPKEAAPHKGVAPPGGAGDKSPAQELARKAGGISSWFS